LTIRADGDLEPFIEGSAKPVSVQVTNAGIAVVEQCDLRIPGVKRKLLGSADTSAFDPGCVKTRCM
jgi:hypothetical protein